jgi:putative toxin-antitoxin system antitoxin component (TIGR02293 family)
MKSIDIAGHLSYLCRQSSIRMKTNVKKEEQGMVGEIPRQLNVLLRKYLQDAGKKNNYQLVSGGLTFDNLFSDRMLLVLVIREGIPFDFFELLRKISPFTLTQWSEMLDISTKSLLRYRDSKRKFKAIHSEKIIELAEVTRLGLDIFDSGEQFRLWLETPNQALGRQKPMDLLHDSYGKDLVAGELTRIDQGIFA